MKRLIALFLTLATIFSLVACKGESSDAPYTINNNFVLSSNVFGVEVGVETAVEFSLITDKEYEKISLICEGKSFGEFKKSKDNNTYTATIRLKEDFPKVASFYAKSNTEISPSLEINFYKNYSEQELAEVDSVSKKITQVTTKINPNNNDKESKEKSFQALKDELTKTLNPLIESKTIKTFTFTEGDICITMSSGYIFYQNVFSEEGFWYTPKTSSQAGMPKILKTGTRKMLLLQPNRDECSCNDMYDALEYATRAQEHDFGICQYTDINLLTLLNIKNYEVILYEGHGAYIDANGAIPAQYAIVIDDVLTAQANEQFKPEIGHTIFHARSKNGTEEYLYVTGGFFKNHFKKDDLNGSVIFMTSCNSMSNDIFANSLIGCGAKAVLGYKQNVTAKYGHDMAKAVFSSLAFDKTTLSKAVDSAKSSCGKTDPNITFYEKCILYTVPAELRLLPSNSNYKLSDIKQTDNSSGESSTTPDTSTTTKPTTTTKPPSNTTEVPTKPAYSWTQGSNLYEENAYVFINESDYKNDEIRIELVSVKINGIDCEFTTLSADFYSQYDDAIKQYYENGVSIGYVRGGQYSDQIKAAASETTQIDGITYPVWEEVKKIKITTPDGVFYDTITNKYIWHTMGGEVETGLGFSRYHNLDIYSKTYHG